MVAESGNIFSGLTRITIEMVGISTGGSRPPPSCRQLQLVQDPSPALLGHRLLPLFDDTEPGKISLANGVPTKNRLKQPFRRLELLGGTIVHRQAVQFLLRQVVLVPNSRSKSS